MTYFIFCVVLFSFLFPSWIQCQSGAFNPVTGRIDNLTYDLYYRMVSEPDCLALCLKYTSSTCYAVSYESFLQECRIITQPIPSTFIPDQLFLNWRSFILKQDS
ncbi:unnamed protein product [Rotaria socialis]|uniref:Apple domain-containing protein n=1 Tax=Rotaria socialis TaxID=392032 RepID=A0A818G0A1_9BILA|nr:unnamed protein product [Rotaria socialis]CAF3441062.1 unnamed protein product [Rotaria socialis]CAF3484313.1 unnamed protein product [Rotaria socialis]CAF4221071.1 unnamed protein product [Rotaria socialis]CAF4451166.1 unnamed protein product [Rotaria socialis]